jgi:hypothetical protein
MTTARSKLSNQQPPPTTAHSRRSLSVAYRRGPEAGGCHQSIYNRAMREEIGA